MRVAQLYRYPVKGLAAEPLAEVTLRRGECLPQDRRFALAQGDNPFNPAAPAWMSKRQFGCLAMNAGLALLDAAFSAATGTLALRAPDGTVLAGDTTTAAGRAEIAAFLTRHLGAEARGTPRFLEAPGHNFTDVAPKCVSLLGLASLAALEQASGTRLDPLRFRANVHLSGGAPWAEFDLVGQEIRLGGARLRVFKRIVRCPATQVNPVTAQRDADPPAWLRQHFGHADLGVYAEVLEPGRVAPGDTLVPVQGSLLSQAALR